MSCGNQVHRRGKIALVVLLGQLWSLDAVTHSAPTVLTRSPVLRRNIDSDCAPISDIPVQGLQLSDEEKTLLPEICWKSELAAEDRLRSVRNTPRRGIPPGVQCNETQWCDAQNYCTDVCERGTVTIAPWLDFAIKTQLNLTRRLPLCYATLLGTHNSAISIADGYGNLDEQFQGYFQYIKWVAGDAPLRTNDHWVSLTDQMNLGVRVLELDTHWVEGALRIAHCGGFHSSFNALVSAVNFVAKLLGHPIHWDTETVGCEPSLSSIAVTDQRLFKDALLEIKAWLDLPQNAHEFVMLYLDDQLDLSLWGFVPNLLADITAVFPKEQIMTPPDHAHHANGTWKSIDEMAAAGKRVMFISSSDYLELMYPLIFSRSMAGPAGVCDWTEPGLNAFDGQPDCIALPPPVTDGKTLHGRLWRMSSCEILYGPFNCDFNWRPDNEPVLDVDTLPDVTSCGLNVPSPDLLTPERAAAAIWTWAPGHPFTPSTAATPLSRASHWLQELLGVGLADAQCAVVSSADARWRAADCTASRVLNACKSMGQPHWQLAGGARGACPDGTHWAVPQHAKDNVALQRALQKATASAAWLPISGPEWQLPST